MVFWANNALVEYRDPQDGRLAMGLKADIRIASSLDGGASWSGAASAFPSAAEAIGISAGRIANSPAMFIASDGLENRPSAGAWTSPARIAAYKKGFLAGSTETSADRHNAMQRPLARVDARYRRSDRHPWNPLGGGPLGDDPDWDNDDLFVRTNLPQTLVSVVSNEPDNGLGDGDTADDIKGAALCRDLMLRAERSGNGPGRVYTLTYAAHDGAGNVGTARVTVAVPLDHH